MLKYIKADSKEHIENDILVLEDHYGAKVIEKPHSWNGKEWWATVDVPREVKLCR